MKADPATAANWKIVPWVPTADMGRKTSLAVRHLSTAVGIRLLDQLVSNASEAMADGDIPNSKDESMDHLVSRTGVRSVPVAREAR